MELPADSLSIGKGSVNYDHLNYVDVNNLT